MGLLGGTFVNTQPVNVALEVFLLGIKKDWKWQKREYQIELAKLVLPSCARFALWLRPGAHSTGVA